MNAHLPMSASAIATPDRGPDHEWSPDQVAELTRLWAEGLSGTEIGKRLGVTKSAAVGKAHRLHLPARPSPIKRLYKPRPVADRPRRAAMPGPMRAGLPGAKELAPRPVDQRTVDARREARRKEFAAAPVGNAQCKWPIGHPDESDFHFCADKAVVGKPYCAEHCGMAFVRVKPSGAL